MMVCSITIATVCVSAQRVNVALNKSAIQSSDYDRNVFPASKAVDGVMTGTGNDFTHTKDGSGNWWQVDLGDLYDIDEIVIWNRVDECCWNRLQNFYVMVSEMPITSNSTENSAFSGPSSFTRNFPNVEIAKRGKGRWVRIFTNNGTMALSLAEVQVFGKPAGGASSPNSEDKPATILSSQANEIAFSPDGRTLASVGNDKTIKLWDVASGANIKTLSHSVGFAGLTSVAFSPDGKTLASGGGGGIKLWSVASGANTKTLADGVAGYWIDLAFSPDGKTLASGGDSIILWDIASGAKTKTFGRINRRLAFSPDGKTIVSTGAEIDIWDLASGTKRSEVSGSRSSAVISVAIAPDGKTFASGTYIGPIKLWNIASGMNTKSIGSSDDFRLSVAFSPDGKTIASGGQTTIKLWDVASGTNTKTLSGHSGGVISIAFSPDGKTLASASMDNTIRLWRVK